MSCPADKVGPEHICSIFLGLLVVVLGEPYAIICGQKWEVGCVNVYNCPNYWVWQLLQLSILNSNFRVFTYKIIGFEQGEIDYIFHKRKRVGILCRVGMRSGWCSIPLAVQMLLSPAFKGLPLQFHWEGSTSLCCLFWYLLRFGRKGQCMRNGCNLMLK